MSLLVHLPSALFADIALNYIDEFDLLRFDTACCNSGLRSGMVSEFACLPESRFPVYCEIKVPSVAQYNWMISRNVKISFLIVDKLCLANQQLAFSVDFSRVVDLRIYGQRNLKSSFVRIANACINLKSLGCIHCDFVSAIDPKILGNLWFLAVVDETAKNAPSLKHIETYCKSLTEFQFIHRKVAHDVIPVLKSLPLLKSVQVYSRSEVFEFIIDFCPLIDHITMLLDESCDLRLLMKKITENPCCNITFSGSETVTYEHTQGKRELVVHGYQNEVSDFEALVAATHELTAFVVTAVVSDALITSVVDNSFRTLKTFLCEVFQVSNVVLRRVLTECKLLEQLQFSLVDSNIDEIFHDVTEIRLESIMIAGGELNLSTVLTILKSCHNLHLCALVIATHLDVEISTVKDCLMEYQSSQAHPVCAQIHYFESDLLKILEFKDGLFTISEGLLDPD